MNEKFFEIAPSTRNNSQHPTVQPLLWPDQGQSATQPLATSEVSVENGVSSLDVNQDVQSHHAWNQKALQDLLLPEALLAAKLSLSCDSLEQLQTQLITYLSQNSQETRVRYSQSVLRWFFADGNSGLASRVWAAYQDEGIEKDILRYLYLVAEPLMGRCVADALYPLEEC